MLTDTQIRKSNPGPKAYKLADAHSLYVYVAPTGTKSFRYDFRLNGHWKTMTYGQYPVVSLAEARQAHLKARQALHQGVDPRTSSQNSQRTFQETAKEWLKQWSANKAERTVFYVSRRLALDVYPALGDRSLVRLTLQDVRNCVQAIDHRGHPEMGKRVLMIVKQVMHWATVNGMLATNPISDLKPKDILTPTTVRNYARIDAKQLPDLLKAIEVYQGKPITRLAVRLMVLTFVRTSELIQARWTELDLPQAQWTIPADHMKMRRLHIVPLSKQALQVLDLLQRLTGKCEYLFPGEGKKNPTMSNNTILKALDRMGYKGVMTGHGFRGLASTILHEQGFDPAWIETQLAHAPRNAVAAAYNHAQYLTQRTRMMQEWADYLDSLVNQPSAESTPQYLIPSSGLPRLP